ncbi:JmjC domain-containing protein [Pseudomonas sp. M5A4_2d]
MEFQHGVVSVEHVPWNVPKISMDWLSEILLGDVGLRDFLVIKEGSSCKKSVYFRSCKEQMLLLIRTLYSKEGCTLYLRRVEYYDACCLEFYNQVQKSFPKAKVQLNVFFTPPGAFALPAHSDDHDLLIIQVSGEKEWFFWRPLPEESCLGFDSDQISFASREHANKHTVEQRTTLEPGSYFFMRKGTIHRARCNDLPSVHLSIWLDYD